MSLQKLETTCDLAQELDTTTMSLVGAANSTHSTGLARPENLSQPPKTALVAMVTMLLLLDVVDAFVHTIFVK
tara:strand:- start:28 stop:246 length:219 start_codon:yes stop_codon:yes gene_type:complete